MKTLSLILAIGFLALITQAQEIKPTENQKPLYLGLIELTFIPEAETEEGPKPPLRAKPNFQILLEKWDKLNPWKPKEILIRDHIMWSYPPRRTYGDYLRDINQDAPPGTIILFEFNLEVLDR